MGMSGHALTGQLRPESELVDAPEIESGGAIGQRANNKRGLALVMGEGEFVGGIHGLGLHYARFVEINTHICVSKILTIST